MVSFPTSATYVRDWSTTVNAYQVNVTYGNSTCEHEYFKGHPPPRKYTSCYQRDMDSTTWETLTVADD